MEILIRDACLSESFFLFNAYRIINVLETVILDEKEMQTMVIGARAERGPGGHADAVETHLAQRRFPSTEGEEERTPNNGARDPAPPKPCEVQGVGGRSPTSPVWPCSGAPTSAPPRAKP